MCYIFSKMNIILYIFHIIILYITYTNWYGLEHYKVDNRLLLIPSIEGAGYSLDLNLDTDLRSMKNLKKKKMHGWPTSQDPRTQSQLCFGFLDCFYEPLIHVLTNNQTSIVQKSGSAKPIQSVP